MGRAIGGLAALAAVAGVGCFGADADDADAAAAFERDEEAYLERQGRAACEYSERCFGPTDLAFGTVVRDLRADACVESYAAQKQGMSLLQPSIEAGRIAYHPEHLEACLSALESRGCLEAPIAQPCKMAFEGQLAEGEPCGLHFDCEGDAFCGFDVNAEAGECPPTCRRRAGEGEPCTTTVSCVDGLVCRDPEWEAGGGAGRSCLPPASEGERCHGLHCSAGLVCTLEPSLVPVCRSLDRGLPEGAPCGPNAQCAGDLACRAAEADAEPTCTPAREGDACTNAASCGPGHVCACDPLDCNLADDMTCQRWPADGEPCAFVSQGPLGGGPMCGAGLRCVSGGVCAPLAKEGESCEVSGECLDGPCIDGRCVAPGECG